MKAFFGFIAILGFASFVAAQDCPRGEFQCGNDRCIPERWVCDGQGDCEDGSDEPDDCGPCSRGQFQCTNGLCVSGSWICDGDNDCRDNSDEFDPATGQCPVCPEMFFKCNNGRCQEYSNVCNGRDDCGDKSDEPGFGNPDAECPPCDGNQLRCPMLPSDDIVPPGACILPEYICDEDGIWDCVDGWDETNCTTNKWRNLQ